MKISLKFPLNPAFSEVFAFCSEYYASDLFWKEHKESLNRSASNRLENLVNLEKEKNLDKEDSVIEPTKNPHDFAFVFGIIILTRYSKTWPDILINLKHLNSVL